MAGLRTIATAAEIYAEVRALRAIGKSIGLVPTMGALHEGHLSLVRRARNECDVVVATIFVNPSQFGPQEDFSRYPRTLERDLELLAAEGCDLVFAPPKDEIYPPGFSTYVEPPAVSLPLEGKCRAGHFRGVATVVLKLFNLIPADVAYFGQKDYQQSLVIRHMVRDLNLPIQIAVCPIVREGDGLALSSRNRYLSPAERQQALALSRSLKRANELVCSGQRDPAAIAAAMRGELTAAGIERIDYATVADAQTLEELNTLDRSAVALVACFVGTTRLIDNCLLNSPS
jgi:pantoate--beta-alanine ligase